MNKTLNKIYELQKGDKPKGSPKFNYQLNQKTEYRVWYDNLRRELKAMNLLNVIDLRIPLAREYSDNEKSERDSMVCGVIVSRLDEYNHKLVLRLEEPLRLLETLIVHYVTRTVDESLPDCELVSARAERGR